MSASLPKLPYGNPDEPEASSVHIVAPEALDSTSVSQAVRYWMSLKGARKFPSRQDMALRDMTPFLRNVVLIRVIDKGADFEYRIAGDAHVQAHGLNFQGMRVSQVEALAPEQGKKTRATYEYVRLLGEPFAVRGWVGRDVPEAKFCYYETAFLPLGINGEVDHILVVTAYAPRAGLADFDHTAVPR